MKLVYNETSVAILKAFNQAKNNLFNVGGKTNQNNKKLISPFLFFIQEIRRDNAVRKNISNKKMKRKMLGAMWQSCIVLFRLLILYYTIIANVGITIVRFEPLRLLTIVFPILVIWVWTSFAKNFLVKNKREYLKRKNLYDLYTQISKNV